MKPLPAVILEEKACAACRRNTEKKNNDVSYDDGYEKGGN
eukprot:CAMPEP_0170566258 /NCGR_PEP_ID=MMETSP0211-20121228/79716_1 /TAXON_ID=311385 /ORGANISM="Pseudokeronopsis sp., Strain OXSARD2" /LENGTH=39 /DNA_ID= /DNA_START= /DNA_END= /DNA_ORIENTATION=